jgi:hypothetical protein
MSCTGCRGHCGASMRRARRALGSFVGHARSALRPSPEVLARINETVGQWLEADSSLTASGDAFLM